MNIIIWQKRIHKRKLAEQKIKKKGERENQEENSWTHNPYQEKVLHSLALV